MRLSEIRPGEVDRLQHVALMRLTLRVMGETHRILGDLQQWLVGEVRRRAADDGAVGVVELGSLAGQVESRWRDAMQEWRRLFDAALVQAGSLPFGALVVRHNYFMGLVQQQPLPSPPLIGEGAIGRWGELVEEPLPSPPLSWEGAIGRWGELVEDFSPAEVGTIINRWQERRARALQAASVRTMPDGLTLSQRIWRLENGGLQQIQGTLAGAYAERTNAYDLAARLEAQLGANQDLPRWTATRLYRMTPSERATDERGLLRGAENRGRGVAYNALRLARTEIQYANVYNHIEIARHSPWVTGKKVRLSPQHPVSDQCDGLAAGGPYAVQDVVIPAHPNCVTPGQLVMTQWGSIPIEEIQVGDLVVTHQGRYRPVKSIWASPHDDIVYVFKTSCGQFELTGNHPVLLAGGWRDAQFTQVGDQVLYALGRVGLDLKLSKMEDTPPLFCQPSVAGSVVFDFNFVPAAAITFDADLDRGQSNVDEIAPYLEFGFVDDPSRIKGVPHGDLQRAGVGKSVGSIGLQHRNETRVVSAFGSGDFAGDFGAPRGVVVAGEIKRGHGFTHSVCGGLTTGAVISSPTGGDSSAALAHGNVVQTQEFTQHAKGEAIKSEDLRSAQFLIDIDGTQQVSNGHFVFGLQAEPVILGGAQTVRGEMGSGHGVHRFAADGAGDHHGLLFVDVQEISQRHYAGLVYNMEVEEDHSYTVNGAIVHNCLCYEEYVVMEDRVFAQQTKDWLNGQNTFLDEYQGWLGVRQPTEPMPWAMTIADSLELWLGISSDGHAAVLRLQ